MVAASTIELLRRYRKGEHLEQAIPEVAHAEGYEQDPLKTHPASSQEADACRVARAAIRCYEPAASGPIGQDRRNGRDARGSQGKDDGFSSGAPPS